MGSPGIHLLGSIPVLFPKLKVTVTVEPLPSKTGDVSSTPLVCAGCLLTGGEVAFVKAERSRTLPDLPEQAAFHPVSRRPAQTSVVRKTSPVLSVYKA